MWVSWVWVWVNGCGFISVGVMGVDIMVGTV